MNGLRDSDVVWTLPHSSGVLERQRIFANFWKGWSLCWELAIRTFFKKESRTCPLVREPGYYCVGAGHDGEPACARRYVSKKAAPKSVLENSFSLSLARALSRAGKPAYRMSLRVGEWAFFFFVRFGARGSWKLDIYIFESLFHSDRARVGSGRAVGRATASTFRLWRLVVPPHRKVGTQVLFAKVRILRFPFKTHLGSQSSKPKQQSLQSPTLGELGKVCTPRRIAGADDPSELIARLNELVAIARATGRTV